MSSTSLIQRKLSQDSFLLNIGMGLIPGYENILRYGRNPDVDSGTAPEDVWDGGGLYTGQPLHAAAAEVVQVFSSSALDTAAGTGARSIRITGLNELWQYTTEVIVLNGVTPVPTVSLWRRVWLGEVLTAGTGGGNAGTITCRNSPTVATVFFIMPIGRNRTASGVYTVPEGKILFAHNVNVKIARANAGTGTAEYSVRVRAENSVYQAVRYNSVTTSYVDTYDLALTPLPARVDIKAVCESSSDNDTSISASFLGILVDT